MKWRQTANALGAAVAACSIIAAVTAAAERNWSAVAGWTCCVLWIATAFIWQRTAALWHETAEMRQEIADLRAGRAEMVITDWDSGRGRMRWRP